MAPSQAPVPELASGGHPETISFRFPVTWTCLAEPLGSVQTQEKPSPAASAAFPASPPKPSSSNLLLTVPVAPEIVASPRPADSWEMVIPKGRPAARPSRVVPSSASSEPAAPIAAPVGAPTESDADLGLPTLGGFVQDSGFHLSAVLKLAAAAVVVLVIAGIVFFTSGDKQQPPAIAENVEVGPSLQVGLAGWIADFTTMGGGSQWGRRISLLRGSQKLTDFRMEFPGQIDSKAIGWVFRAKDSKTFYVTKLEIIKPLPESTGVLTRFAVINGREQQRVQVPLAMPLRPNIVYGIRLDAVGSSFTTWVQGQKVDQWTDSQIREGGVGLYSEAGERNSLKGEITVHTLLVKSQSKR